MSGARKTEGMSSEDLKRKMYSSLQSAGVLNDLRVSFVHWMLAIFRLPFSFNSNNAVV